MKPFYEEDNGIIYCADCRDILPETTIPIITDPPYNVKYHYEHYEDNLSQEDYDLLLKLSCRAPSVIIHYPEELFRISHLINTIPTEMIAWNYNANTPHQWRGICWFGLTPDLSLDGQDYKNPNDTRIIKQISKGQRARLYDWWNIQQVKNVSKEKTEHPCQIPLDVMIRILKITNQKEICDPFCGSGTTLLAAKLLGQRFIGIDNNPEYCKIAVERLKDKLKRQYLF